MNRSRWATRLGFRNMSAVYLLIAELVVFSIWLPETFLTTTTLTGILGEQAVTAMVAMGLVVSLSAGLFDLSVAAALGMGAIVVTKLTVDADFSVPAAIAVTMVIGLAIGLGNTCLVVLFKIDSFIAALAMSSVVYALIVAVSGNKPAVGVPDGLSVLGATKVLGVQLPVIYMVILAVLLWFGLEHTTTGRYIYATGGARDAARLAGVRTGRIMGLTLIASAVIATFAGIVATARVGAGSPDIGPPYLLPAFAAAFLGATQFKGGRYNIAGTIVAVYVLAVGVKGLQLAGAPFWLPGLFNGVALALAVGLTGLERRNTGRVKRTDLAPPAPAVTEPTAIATKG